MDVQLYVYDLSRGIARQMSLAFLGVQIDAVYHTSLVFGNVEYFFGAGVQTCYPGTTHHGQPMEKFALGRTDLPLEVILEYLESLKAIYTAESYDLFMHNCNNFSNDFAMFLVGKGIPQHITSLPQKVLDTPFGQMLKPQLDQAMRGLTQAPVPPSRIPPQRQASQAVKGASSLPATGGGRVHNVASLREVQTLLKQASNSCAVVFFTSSTCAPCKICYEPFDRLAEEFADKATLIKVDIGIALDVGTHYGVRATPTFTSFLKGEKLETWSGADPGKLAGNTRLLVQMANPSHPHRNQKLSTLQRSYRPDLYTAVPPLDKLIAKLGSAGQSSQVQGLKEFVLTRQKEGAADAAVPDLKSISAFINDQVAAGQTDNLFALIDLMRVALVDPRISGYFVEDSKSTVWNLIDTVNDLEAVASPAARLVTAQLACNLFSTPLLHLQLSKNSPSLIRLAAWLLLDESSNLKTRECAATLVSNIAKTVQSQRLEDKPEPINEGDQVELAVCLLESIQRNEESEVLKRSALALGLLVFLSAQQGEMRDVLDGMEALAVIRRSKVQEVAGKDVWDDLNKVLS